MKLSKCIEGACQNAWMWEEVEGVLIMAREQLRELYKNHAVVEWEDVDAIDAINQWVSDQEPRNDPPR